MRSAQLSSAAAVGRAQEVRLISCYTTRNGWNCCHAEWRTQKMANKKTMWSTHLAGASSHSCTCHVQKEAAALPAESPLLAPSSKVQKHTHSSGLHAAACACGARSADTHALPACLPDCCKGFCMPVMATHTHAVTKIASPGRGRGCRAQQAASSKGLLHQPV